MNSTRVPDQDIYDSEHKLYALSLYGTCGSIVF